MLYDPDSYASYKEQCNEEQYFNYLEENCKCDIEGDGCSCMTEQEYFEDRDFLAGEDAAEAAKDYEEDCG